MKQILLFSIALLSFCTVSAQDQLSEGFSAYVKAVAAIGDGNVELGPQYAFGDLTVERQWTGKLALRMNLTDKDQNLLQVDRNTTDWTLLGEVTSLKDNTGQNGSCRQLGWSLQFELGRVAYTYYPNAMEAEETIVKKMTGALELKGFLWYTKCAQGAWQVNPQGRLRYSKAVKAADEVGVVLPFDTAATYTIVQDMVIEGPSVLTRIEPAIACNIYPGSGNFSYTPAVYYSAELGEGQDFGERIAQSRFEFWTFFYPKDNAKANGRFGVAPFLAIPMHGSSQKEPMYGALFTVQFNTSFVKFF